MKEAAVKKVRQTPNKSRGSIIRNRLWNDKLLYLMLIPVLAWYVIFCYLPMGGITLAFRNYR